MGVHVLEAGVLYVDFRSLACDQLGAGRLDPAGQLCDLALGFGHLGLRFADLRIKVCH
jgi:hypothetical protein